MRASPALSLLLLVALGGCASGLAMGTARPTPVGELQHQVALEAGPLYSFLCESDSCGAVSPLVSPAYGVRYGLADSLEVGGKFAVIGATADLKYAPLVTRYFDLAVAPQVGVENYFDPEDLAGVVRLPVLVDVNVSSSVSLIGQVGIGTKSRFGSRPVYLAKSAAAGFDFRVSESVSLTPQVGVFCADHCTEPFTRLEGGGVVLSLGASFGAIPAF